VAWEVEVSDEFGKWWDSLNAAEQKSVDFSQPFAGSWPDVENAALFWR